MYKAISESNNQKFLDAISCSYLFTEQCLLVAAPSDRFQWLKKRKEKDMGRKSFLPKMIIFPDLLPVGVVLRKCVPHVWLPCFIF